MIDSYILQGYLWIGECNSRGRDLNSVHRFKLSALISATLPRVSDWKTSEMRNVYKVLLSSFESGYWIQNNVAGERLSPANNPLSAIMLSFLMNWSLIKNDCDQDNVTFLFISLFFSILILENFSAWKKSPLILATLWFGYIRRYQNHFYSFLWFY